MTDDYAQHGKEVSPEDTVERLIGILESVGVEVEEHWMDVELINTSSLRIVERHSRCGTNGKGVSRAYTRASAYAEFMERFQNGLLGSEDFSHFGLVSAHPFQVAHDERRISTTELVSQESSFFDWFFGTRGIDDATASEKADTLEMLKYEILSAQPKKPGFLSLPYYSVRRGTIEYIPKYLSSYLYGSNGMSAGNTTDEAVVQGLSEILERYAQRKIVLGGIAVPTFPDEVVERYPTIWKMVEALRATGKYECLIKDCSLGGRYPVVALVVVERNSGCYGVHFGCHPSYAIAMERTFTEATQGRDNIDAFAKSNTVDFSNRRSRNWTNLRNIFCKGAGAFPFEMLSADPSLPFSPCADAAGLPNSRMAHDMVKRLLDEGRDVLIRDHSYLGFPTVQIIVPGLSEMIDATDDANLMNQQIRHLVRDALMKPDRIDADDALQITACLDYFIGHFGTNDLGGYYPWANVQTLPLCGDTSAYGSLYLSALAKTMLGKYGRAATHMQKVLDGPTVKSCSTDEITSLECQRRFCEAMDALGDLEAAFAYLEVLFDKPYADRVRELFCGERSCIAALYPAYDAKTRNPAVDARFALAEKLRDAMSAHPIDQLASGRAYSFSDLCVETATQVAASD